MLRGTSWRRSDIRWAVRRRRRDSGSLGQPMFRSSFEMGRDCFRSYALFFRHSFFALFLWWSTCVWTMISSLQFAQCMTYSHVLIPTQGCLSASAEHLNFSLLLLLVLTFLLVLLLVLQVHPQSFARVLWQFWFVFKCERFGLYYPHSQFKSSKMLP